MFLSPLQKTEILKAMEGEMHAQGLFRSCIGCLHFEEEREECRCVGKRPPARVIATGCEAYEAEDDIPF